MHFLRRPFVLLLTVPAGIALAIAAAALPLIGVERVFGPVGAGLDVDTARSVLTTTASSAITALSLTWSIMLVVFTLAAGNVGPRLLKRFATDRVNQITAGLLGGTFLYALVALGFTSPDHVPGLAVGGAVALAVLSVLQLVYFVRHVSQTVTIDDEVAAITERLQATFDEARSRQRPPPSTPPDGHTVRAPTTGYLAWVDTSAAVRWARAQDARVDLLVPPGAFVLEGDPMVRITGDAAPDALPFVGIEPSRSEAQTVHFPVHLLVEIALRALSPGVNDTYTAIAVADRLTGALARVVDLDDLTRCERDDDGRVRLVVPGPTVAELVDRAFGPLRRASADNVLMATTLAGAVARLYPRAGASVRPALRSVAALLLRSVREAGALDEDVDAVATRLGELARPAG